MYVLLSVNSPCTTTRLFIYISNIHVSSYEVSFVSPIGYFVMSDVRCHAVGYFGVIFLYLVGHFVLSCRLYIS